MKLLYHPKHQHLNLAIDLGGSWRLQLELSEELIASMVRSMTNLDLTERQIQFLIDQTDYFCDKVCSQQCMEERETSMFTRNEFIEYLSRKLIEANIELPNFDLITDTLLLLYSLECMAYYNDENEPIQSDSDQIEVLVQGKWECFKIDTIRQWWVNQQLWEKGLGFLDCYYNCHLAFTVEDIEPIRKIGYDFVIFACRTDDYPSENCNSKENLLTLWVNFRNKICSIKEMTAMEYSDTVFEWVSDSKESDFLRSRLSRMEQDLPEELPFGTPLQRFSRLHIQYKADQFPSPEELPF